MRKSLPFLIVVATMLYGSARIYSANAGGQVWQKKQYTEWSPKECDKILQDSPWAKSYSFEEILIQQLSSNSNSSLGREAKPEMFYNVQLMSALPIRHAIVRQRLIRDNYDKLTAEQKAAYDKQIEPFLSGKKFEDKVVVHVDFGSNIQDDAREMVRLWQAETKDTLQTKAFLLAHGSRIPLSGFAISQGKNEFQMVFPKSVDGQAVVTPETKSIAIEFQHPAIRNASGSAPGALPTQRAKDPESKRVLVEFKIDKMMYNGQVAY